MSPLVSIIIPVFNAEKYLTETINSAINQTYPNKEIIIVDDGSTDNSLPIAKQFERTWIKIYTQKNKGASAARNKGLLEATGDYIQFLDADDLLSENKIANQLKLLLQNHRKIAVCRTVHFYNNENFVQIKPSAYEDSFLFDSDSPTHFLINLYGGDNNRGSMIQTNAWLIPKDIIRKAGCWSEFYSPDDDGEFFCRVILASQGIIYADDCFNYYRKHKTAHHLAAIKTKEALHGKFKSFLLKKQYLLQATDNVIAKKALAHSAMDLAIDAYTVDKTLTTKILNVIKDLGGTDYSPELGGKMIESVKKIFGWKLTLTMKHHYKRFLDK